MRSLLMVGLLGAVAVAGPGIAAAAPAAEARMERQADHPPGRHARSPRHDYHLHRRMMRYHQRMMEHHRLMLDRHHGRPAH